MNIAAVVLDNEAVQALLDPHHAKHRRIVALLSVANRRNVLRAGEVIVVVPTPVRVEAGWDRTARHATSANRLARPRDRSLDSQAANRATQLRAAVGVSVVDAAVAEAAESAARPVTIITSDVRDVTNLVSRLREPSSMRIVQL